MKWSEFVSGLDDIRSSIRANKNPKTEVPLDDSVFGDLQALARRTATIQYPTKLDKSRDTELPERDPEAGFTAVEKAKEESKKSKPSGPIILPRDPNEGYKSREPDIEEVTEETVED